MAALRRRGSAGSANTSASSAILPRPISSTAAIMRPSRDKRLVGKRDQKAVGIGGGRGAAKRARKLKLGAFGVQRAERDEGGRRGAADAGPAMDEERRLAVPFAREFDEVGDMRLARQHEAGLRLADVVHGESQMPVRPDAGRRVDEGLAVDQRHEMADIGVGDRGLDQAQGRDIDGFGAHAARHSSRFSWQNQGGHCSQCLQDRISAVTLIR